MPAKYAYIGRRFLVLIPTVVLAVTIVFFLMDVVPGDTAMIILGQEANPESISVLRQRLGLDQPLYIRYFTWLSRVLMLDLGNSLRTRESINALIAMKLPTTLWLTAYATFFSILIGIPAGIVSAVKRNTKTDLAVSIGAFIGVSTPGFWMGLMMILVFSLWLPILPSSGYVNPLVDPIQGTVHLLMPAIVNGAIMMAFVARMTRSTMLEVLMEDYIVTARAKGLAERIVIYRHALKNALIPVVTIIGFQIGGLLGGSVITEEIFSLGGMGKLVYGAVLGRDYTLIQGCALVMVLIYVVTNLVVDVLYMYLDPRVRFD